ncbi:uncharacterized protein LOC779208 [Xenopus laevis]|uniref:MGC154312 protein n=1 Tax=Xenopus laevis TaxID=8355 RepID=Q0IHJ7_XENLA|nr:uncharacterized protein LOC779208 [Xenopus laevis]AAI23128.1 MGC154312 protein [Xenopus laevis]
MSSNRTKVFVSNVLKRLYPEEADCEDSTSRLLRANLPCEEKAETTSSQEDTEQIQVVFPPDEGKEAAPKIYTVLPPPQGYVPSSRHECECSAPSDHSGDDEDTGEGHAARKRRRRKKNRKVTNSLNPETEMNSTQAETPASDQSTISKSKKRKLQRKRQKERKKADTTDSRDTGPPNISVSKGDDTVKSPGGTASEEDQREKAKELLEFLQATQEIYITDRSTNSSASIYVILETLDIMEAGDFPSSDVTLLHHIKTLLLLQDTDGSEEALANFKENSSLPADQRSAICSLFHYWIAHILPLQSKE